MEMEIKIAIEYLSKSIEAIETLKSEKDEGAMEYQKWQESTESMVRNIFGESSAEYKELHELFHPLYFCMPSGGFNERMDYHRQYINRLENAFSKLSGYKTVLMMRVASSNEDQSFSAIKEVVRICSRFSNVTRSMRKRYSNRKPLIIQDEYDVQYLLKSLLSIYFDDIRSEETTPSCAGSYSRMDFLLKAEQIAIETKMTRENLADKELSKQLIQDIAQYQTHHDVNTLVCFVYDPGQYIENPSGIIRDLELQSSDKLMVKVIIVS